MDEHRIQSYDQNNTSANRIEGIHPDQIRFTKELEKKFETYTKQGGVRCLCAIAFGSRARNQGIPGPEGSDLDLFVLVDFGNVNVNIQHVLAETHTEGSDKLEYEDNSGKYHIHVYNWSFLRRKLASSEELSKITDLFPAVARDGIVISGSEPEIQGISLLSYLRTNLLHCVK